MARSSDIPFDPSILNPRTKHLCLSGVSKLSDHDIDMVVDYLRANHPSLKSVTTGSANISMILDALSTNTNIKSLSIEAYDQNLIEFELIGLYLQTNTSITKLALSPNLVPFSEIATMMHDNTPLLAKPKLESKGLSAFFEGIQQNRTLTELYLGSCDLNGFPLSALLTAISLNQSLTELNLRSTAFPEDMLMDLFKACDTNPTLKTIDLSWNRFTSRGIHYIASWIGTTAMITTLHLDNGFQIDAVKTRFFFEGLSYNKHLLYLKYAGDDEPYDEQTVAMIAEMLEYNHTLVRLDIPSINLGDVGAGLIAAALEQNHGLMQLGLDTNGIGNEGAATLLASGLTNIDFGSNEVTDVRVCLSPSIRALRFASETLTRFSIPYDSNLEALYLAKTCLRRLAIPAGSKLKTLDLSDTLITRLIVPHDSNLKHLDLQSCKLKTFDCGSDCQLEWLRISGSMATLPISSMPNLAALGVRSMPNLNLCALIPNIRSISLKELTIKDCRLDDTAAIALSQYLLEPSCVLESLVITNHRMTDTELASLRTHASMELSIEV